MPFDDPHLVVRAASIYVAVMSTIAVWLWRAPDARAVSGATLAFFWNLPTLLAVHLLARRLGWWTFDAQGGLLLGMPVDFYLAWAWLWGAIPALAFPALPLAAVVAIALGLDLLLMPAAAPVLQLGPTWLAGEAAGLLACLLPAQCLARWTRASTQLAGRTVLQVLAFGGLMLLVLPAVIIDESGGSWLPPHDRPAWRWSLWLQAFAVPALIGLTAVQEFAGRGGGTPVPFDPPRRLVTTGIYAYVRNPMQLSAVLVLLLAGVALHNVWLSAAGVMAHLYSLGLARWDEDADLQGRFGVDYPIYRAGVRRWLPTLRPWRQPGTADAQLYVAASCTTCRQVGRWFERRGGRGVKIVPAESHGSGALRRITYEPGDGTRAASGVEAVARALEHVHLGWALIGFGLRLPIVRPLAQLLADASGGHARPALSVAADERSRNSCSR